MGCSATPATISSCSRAVSTAHRAPGRSQPIWTIRGTPTEAARDEGLADGEGGIVVPTLDVEVAVVVHDRMGKGLRQVGTAHERCTAS